MKQNRYLTVVEGDSNEITKHELYYKENPNTGFIDIQKRNSNGVLESIVQNTSKAANPDLPVTTIMENAEFNAALTTLIGLAESSGSASLALEPEVKLIQSYLPNEEEVLYKMPNIIGYIGYKTEDGFVIHSTDESLMAEIGTDSITLTGGTI